MSDVDRYLEAAERADARWSYRTTTRHFEEDWGGHLPATPQSVSQYLADYAGARAFSVAR